MNNESVRFCRYSHGQTRRPDDRCPRCGMPLSPPAQADDDRRLVRAPRRSPPEIRTASARVLGRRRIARTAPALTRLTLGAIAPRPAATAREAPVHIRGAACVRPIVPPPTGGGAVPVGRLAQHLPGEADAATGRPA